MKRTQKANNKLSLFGLAALLALVNASTIKANVDEGYESDQEQTVTIEVVGVTVTATETPEEKALAIIKPFFTDPNYEVTKSFRAMCCEVVPHLEQSPDPVLKAIAQVLKEVCKKNNPVMVGLALKKYENTIKQFIGEMLPGNVLLARLNKALKI